MHKNTTDPSYGSCPTASAAIENQPTLGAPSEYHIPSDINSLMVGGRHMEVTNHPLVEAAYGTRHHAIHPNYVSQF